MTLIRYSEQIDTEAELRAEFKRYVTEQGLGHEGSAHELFLRSDLTTEQRRWLLDFVLRWDVMLRRTTPKGAGQLTDPKTPLEMVDREIDELAKLGAFPLERATSLKHQLTSEVVEQHIQNGMAIRDIIDMYDDLANASGPSVSRTAHGRASPCEEDAFCEAVLACIDDLNSVLPSLAARYEELVVVAALSEHVGGALRIFMKKGICNAEQARRVLQHIEQTAFTQESSE